MHSRWDRRGHPAAPVFLLPLVLAVLQVIGTLGAQRGQPDRLPIDQFAGLLLLGGPAALLLRRRRPAQVGWLTTAVTLAYLCLGYAYGPVFLSFAVGLVAAVRAGHRTAGWLAAWTGYLLYFAGWRGIGHGEWDWSAMAAVGAWLLVLLGGGELARLAAERGAQALRVRQEEERRKAGDERLRIARELHDVVAHSISLINVQAGVALHLLDGDPEQARTALTAIKQTSKDALTELRATISVLRTAEEPAPLTAAKGAAALPELVEQARSTGSAVSYGVTGEPRELPASVDLAVYRITQEALTNVRRHAPGAAVAVAVAYRPDLVEVRVTDDGRGSPAATEPGGGNGIVGMRERVAALGGSLAAGPGAAGGFEVLASFPLSGPLSGRMAG